MRLRTPTLLLLGASLPAAACAVSLGPAPAVPAASAPLAAPTVPTTPAAQDPSTLAAAQNSACEDCHRDIAAEWRGSLHHASWDDPVFLTAYTIEPIAFCRGCHVPEADPHDETPPEPARRLGIGCVTCHVRDGAIVGVRALPATTAAQSPVSPASPASPASPVSSTSPASSDAKWPSGERHAVTGDAAFGTQMACARCHEFDFPEPQEALMQSTMAEHAASRTPGTPCRDCHMPLVAGQGTTPHRSHDFRVIGNVPLLRTALTASASRSAEDPDTILVSLAADRVGHAFPTGDMFRRLEVRARISDDDGAPALAAPPVVLARTFLMMPGPKGVLRQQTGDDRLPSSGEPREVEMVFPSPTSGRAVRWEVAYQRMDAAMATLFGVDPARDEVIVAEGVLPPAGHRRSAPRPSH